MSGYPRYSGLAAPATRPLAASKRRSVARACCHLALIPLVWLGAPPPFLGLFLREFQGGAAEAIFDPCVFGWLCLKGISREKPKTFWKGAGGAIASKRHTSFDGSLFTTDFERSPILTRTPVFSGTKPKNVF